MKKLMIAAAFASLFAGTALTTSSAQASWAESAQTNPVYTGTNRSLWRSQRGSRFYSYQAPRRAWGYGYRGYDNGYDGSYYR
jgi:hypothetical protein